MVDDYEEVELDIKRTLKVTRSTISDLVKSFKEQVPYKAGDVILMGDKIRKVRYIEEVVVDLTKHLMIKLKVSYPEKDGGYSKESYDAQIDFDRIEDHKILYID